jgi:hypothetical protein
MSEIDKIMNDIRDQDLERKFTELHKQLDLIIKEDFDDQLTDRLFEIKNLVNDCNLGATNLWRNLQKALSVAKDYSNRDDFFVFCEGLPKVDQLRQPDSPPLATRELARDFVLSPKGVSDRHYGQFINLTEDILKIKYRWSRENPLDMLERYLIGKLITIFGDSEKDYRHKGLEHFIDEDESVTARQQISPISIDSLREDLGDRFIADRFHNYLERAITINKDHFHDNYIAKPISMNKSDPKAENFDFVLYQSERNIFKAPRDSSNPWKCEIVKVSDILKHKARIAESYQYLLLAPPTDCYGNETYISFNHERNAYLTSWKAKSSTERNHWEAFYEDGHWVQRSHVKAYPKLRTQIQKSKREAFLKTSNKPEER